MHDNGNAYLSADYQLIEVDPGTGNFPSHGQDVSLRLRRVVDNVAATCSLWWTQVPPYQLEVPGVIGHFQADAPDAGSELLNMAAARLVKEGCNMAIGPMDGNTWRRYRLVTERGQHPPFFLEPDNSSHLPAAFTEAGFEPLAHYSSAMVTDLSSVDERMPRVEMRLAGAGVHIRQVDLKNFADDLKRVHQLSLASFSENLLYTALSLQDFVELYTPIQQHVLPQYVLLAEHEGRTVGFIFAIPDLAQVQRGQPLDTIVLKTLAVAPGRTYAGLGALLLKRIHKTAQSQGFKQVIHALMYEGNASTNLSARSAVPFRRYTLYAKKLA